MNRKRLGEVLTEMGALSRKRLEEALAHQAYRADRLGEILVANGLAYKADIGAALECGKGVAYIECPPEEIDPQVLTLIPVNVAARCCALPVSIEGKALVVAMGEPQNMAVLEELEFCSGMTIDPRFSFRSDVVEGIKKFYGNAKPTPEVARPPVAVLQKPVRHKMSWPVRVAAVGAFSVAAVCGWSSGRVVQQAVSGLLTDPRPASEGLSFEPLIDVSESRSETTRAD